MKEFPQVLLNVSVLRKPDLDKVPAIQDAIGAVASELGDRGRVVVRYSGTESLARVMVEALRKKWSATGRSGSRRSFSMRSAKEKMLPRRAAAEQVRAWKQEGKRVVFTNGCFDLLHPGHVQYLEEARQLGDRLVVALNDDTSVRRIKGPGRPIQPGSERAEILAALAAVDLVTEFSEEDPLNIIRELAPDILVKGADWARDKIIGREDVEASGGRVLQIAFEPGYSTSRLLENIRKNCCPDR